MGLDLRDGLRIWAEYCRLEDTIDSPAGTTIRLRYEDVLSNPAATVDTLIDGLALESTSLQRSEAVAVIRAPGVRTPLPAELTTASTKSTLRAHGYPRD